MSASIKHGLVGCYARTPFSCMSFLLMELISMVSVKSPQTSFSIEHCRQGLARLTQRRVALHRLNTNHDKVTM